MRCLVLRYGWTLLLGIALCVALFAFAFVAAPSSCEWGLTAYFNCGVVVIVGLMVLPFVFSRRLPPWPRCLLAFGLGALGAAVWLGGLFAANLRIICRLI